MGVVVRTGSRGLPALLAVCLSFCILISSATFAHARRDSKKKKEKDPFEAATGGVILYSKDYEVKLGKEVKEQVLKQYKLYENQELVDYVRRVGAKVASYADRQNVTYEFFVLDDPLINAFALPGGTIFITRGILTVFTNEAELAGVLGHEITHVVERHSMKQMQTAQLFDIGFKLLNKGQEMPLGYQIATDLLVFKPYGRGDESKADAVGLKYAYEAGYKADEVAHLFQELQKRDESHMPAFLRSHPVDSKRIEQINQLYELIQTRQDIPAGGRPLVTNAEEYAKIANPHSYRALYPQVQSAFEEMHAAVGRKDIDGVMKWVDKKFKSNWWNIDREGYRKMYQDKFSAVDRISSSVVFNEFRFLDKDAISALCTVSETRSTADGRNESSSEKEVVSFVKRENETDSLTWRLIQVESEGKW